MPTGFVGLFFYARGQLLLHTCPLEKAEKYGDFLVYPASHFDIWEERYRTNYAVDFDYFPRGRIVWCIPEKTFWIYRDVCIPDETLQRLKAGLGRTDEKSDEHYVCHMCHREDLI